MKFTHLHVHTAVQFVGWLGKDQGAGSACERTWAWMRWQSQTTV